jgi:hypothetical protein
MSKYVKYYSSRQDSYRTLATMCSNWIKSENPSEEEIIGITKFFSCVGKRFGLIGEFKKIGIL